MTNRLSISFDDEASARTAIDALVRSGFGEGALSITTARETAFILRLVIAIAGWSIVGGAAGVGLGALFWLIIGPEGTTGFIIQAVVWGIFGHLILGLWAGYLLLADRTHEDLPHDRTAVHIVVHCYDEAAARRVREIAARAGGSVSR